MKSAFTFHSTPFSHGLGSPWKKGQKAKLLNSPLQAESCGMGDGAKLAQKEQLVMLKTLRVCWETHTSSSV